MIECGRARRLLWPGRGPMVDSDEIRGAREHVEECGECRRFFGDMDQLATTLSESVEVPPLPDGLKARVLGSMAERAGEPRIPATKPARDRKRTGQHRRDLLRSALIASAALVAIFASSLLVDREPDTDVIEAVRMDHRRGLDGASHRSSDPAELGVWFAGRAPFPIPGVPTFDGARVMGGRICDRPGCDGLAVQYALGDGVFSYYVTRPEVVALTTPGEPIFEERTVDGLSVISWVELGFVHTMVGDLPLSRLRAVVHECRRDYLRTA